jgi:hypothetical protein
MNNLTIPRTTARPSFLRRILVTTGVLGALTTGGVLFAGTAAAAELPTTMTAANASMAFPSWCPFGTHGGRGGGCRGGSIVHEIDDNGYTIATNVGCGLAGTAAGAATANPAVGFGVGVGCGVLLDDDPAE